MTGGHMTTLTEQLLDVSVHAECEERFRKVSQERFEDHSWNVNVTVVVKVHRFPWGKEKKKTLLTHRCKNQDEKTAAHPGTTPPAGQQRTDQVA